MTNREIASALFISENSVKIHLSNLLGKLHVHNRNEAALLVVRDHLELGEEQDTDFKKTTNQ